MAPEGFASIRHVASGETMHARTPPMEEAESLYVDQSELAERLRLRAAENPSEAPPLVIWDVGLGAGANAMAAIRCYEQTAALRRSALSRSSASTPTSTRCGSPSPTGTTFPTCATAVPRPSSAPGAGARTGAG